MENTNEMETSNGGDAVRSNRYDGRLLFCTVCRCERLHRHRTGRGSVCTVCDPGSDEPNAGHASGGSATRTSEAQTSTRARGKREYAGEQQRKLYED